MLNLVPMALCKTNGAIYVMISSPMTEPGREIYTVAEAAAILGIAPTTLYEAVKRREVPSVKVGRRVLIARKALDRFLEGAPGK